MRGRRVLAGVLAASLLAPGSLAAAQGKPQARTEQWRMKYAHDNEDVVVTFGSESINCAGKDGRTISIPTGGIREVAYDDFVRRRLDDVSASPWPPFGVWPLALGLGVAHSIKETRHFVRITWEEDGALKRVWLRAHKNNYAAFLAGLERITGRPMRNLAPEREELTRKLEQAWTNRISLRLEQPVWVNGRKLPPGNYQMVLIEKDEQRGDLYFFREDQVKGVELLVVAPVGVTSTAEASRAPVAYQQREGLPSTLAELRLGEKKLQFPAENQFRVHLEEGKPTVRLVSPLGLKVVASYVEYQGQPAIAFPVLGPFLCVGNLYMTRERIAYQPLAGVNAKCEKDTLDVERSKVKELEPSEFWGGIEVRISLPERQFFFLPMGPQQPEEAPYGPTGELNPDPPVATDSVDFFLLAWENFDAVEAEFQQALAKNWKAKKEAR